MSITIILIFLTCLVSITSFRNQGALEKMVFWPYNIRRKNEYWRFLTCGFIHADYMHLAFNMITLYFFGRIIEGTLFQNSPLGFGLFYLLALACSNMYSYFRHRDDIGFRALGASGAVSAVVFAFIILAPWDLIYVFFLPVPAILYGVLYLGYSAYMGRRNQDHIGHDAHFWGGVFGILYTFALHPYLASSFLERLTQVHF